MKLICNLIAHLATSVHAFALNFLCSWLSQIFRCLYGFSNCCCNFPGSFSSLLGWIQYWACCIGSVTDGSARLQEEHSGPMKVSFMSLFFLFSYILICVAILVLSTRQSTPQPTGLLLVAMVTTPFIVSICGGLPVNCLQQDDWFCKILEWLNNVIWSLLHFYPRVSNAWLSLLWRSICNQI